jgi:hypothetical protein
MRIASRRFEREAPATSALNYPNILTVYGIGSHEVLPFMVAELLDGEKLRQRLSGGRAAATQSGRLTRAAKQRRS